MLRLAPAFVLLAAACSSGAPAPQSAGTESTTSDPQPVAAEPATAEPATAGYGWSKGDRVVRVIERHRTATSVVDGVALPPELSDAKVVLGVGVIGDDNGEYVVEYTIEDVSLNLPHIAAADMKAIENILRGMTHKRSVSARGDSLSMDAYDAGPQQTLIVEISEELQVPILPDEELVAHLSWSDCVVDFHKEDTDGQRVVTCTIDAIHAGGADITVDVRDTGYTEAPTLPGFEKDEAVVESQTKHTTCSYRVAFDAPAPVSATCTASERKTGRVQGKPYVYEESDRGAISTQ